MYTDASTEALRRRELELEQGGWFAGGAEQGWGQQQLVHPIRENHYDLNGEEERVEIQHSTFSSSLDDTSSDLPPLIPPPPSGASTAASTHGSYLSTRVCPPARTTLLHIARCATASCSHTGKKAFTTTTSTLHNNSTTQEEQDQQRARCGLLMHEVEEYWELLAQPLINSFEDMVLGIVAIASVIKRKENEIDIEFDFGNPIVSNRDTILQSLIKQDSIGEVSLSASYLMVFAILISCPSAFFTFLSHGDALIHK